MTPDHNFAMCDAGDASRTVSFELEAAQGSLKGGHQRVLRLRAGAHKATKKVSRQDSFLFAF
jgi:hypothetical protein